MRTALVPNRLHGKSAQQLVAVILRLLGAVFLLSGLLKAADAASFAVQISHFGLVRTPWIVSTLAVAFISIEVALGVMLTLRVWGERLALLLALAMLAGFSLLMFWAWLFTDIKDCGCFGKFVPMSPAAALLKNVIMLAVGLYAAIGLAMKPVAQPSPAGADEVEIRPPTKCSIWRRVRQICGVAVMTVIAAAVTVFTLQSGQLASVGSSGPVQQATVGSESKFGKYRVEWEGKEIDLTRGTYLVALLSDSCEHCAELVSSLNRLAADSKYLPVVGLILGDEDTFVAFKQKHNPRFATTRIPVLEFFDLIGNAPPRFYLLREGAPLQYWDEKLPPDEKLVKSSTTALLSRSCETRFCLNAEHSFTRLTTIRDRFVTCQYFRLG